MPTYKARATYKAGTVRRGNVRKAIPRTARRFARLAFPRLRLFRRAGVKLAQGETLCVIGKTAEERKLARFVAANPSDAFRRKSGMVALVRRTGAADFWAAHAPDKTGTRCVLFIGAK